MKSFNIKVKSFKKIDDPNDDLLRKRFVFLANVGDLQKNKDLLNWMSTNPRDQNTDTNVAKEIRTSLSNPNTYFHELNRGILFSAEDVSYNNKTEIASFSFSNPDIHGNIDGGHTLRVILENNDLFSPEKYVFVEVIVGLNRNEVIELAEARNTSVQVDRISIEELNGTFLPLKTAIGGAAWFDRVKWRQNQASADNMIDGRVIISIFNMFNVAITENKSSVQPVYAYSGKETSLKKFIEWKNQNPNYEKYIAENADSINQIFALFDVIQKELPSAVISQNKRYGTLPFAGEKNTAATFFSNETMEYNVPLSLVYPIISAFRANMKNESGKIVWKINPFELWNKTKEDVAIFAIEEVRNLANNPNTFGKRTNVWTSLYNIVNIKIFEILNK